MQRSHELDSRDVLIWYQRVSLPAGLIVVFWRWPMPTSFTAQPLDVSAIWSALLTFSALAIWLSGATALGLSRIEDPTTRKWALRCFGYTITFLPLIVFLNGFGLTDRLPAAFLWLPLISGMVLTGFTYDSSARRRPLVPSSLSLHATVIRDIPSLRGPFEESIRQAARQEERTRPARELHDAVKQQLFVIQTAAATVETRFDGDPAGAREALVQVRASARDALTEMEVMLEQLQATPVANVGLMESLKRQCEVLRFRTGADVTFEAGELPPETTLEPGAHQAMLRFAQEALANVARHARAPRTKVSLTTERDVVILAVTDDGSGFDTKAPPTGIGLASMAARAAEAGGVFEVKSAPGAGTTVRLLAPTVREAIVWHRRNTLIGIGFLAIAIAFAFNTTWPQAPWVVIITMSGVAGFRSALLWWRASR
jgi:signal transduction histidine kinase